MSDFVPLNPHLYGLLQKQFGKVKVDRAGQKMIRLLTPGQFDEVEILNKGETYRVCCLWCGDAKFKLYINYTFGMTDQDTGQVYYINNCYRCGPKTTQLRELIEWVSIPQCTAPIGEVGEEAFDAPEYAPPGLCVRLDDPRAKRGWDYLANRGIDPLEATNRYAVCFCIKGNPDVYFGGMEGRLIFPVTKDGEHVGWQARLAFEPNVFDKDRNFKNLRWITMPGVWRSKYLMGYDQAKNSKAAILVEGPSDLVAQGPPCIASLGQTLSFGQARLIRDTWSRIIVVGDHQDKEDGTENRVQAATVKILMRENFDAVHLIKLPHDDPGKWEREAFNKFVIDQIKANPKGECKDNSIGAALGHGV